jgi:hypothetical protein
MSNRADEPQEGVGLYRGPGERWPGPPSEHAPVAPFGPFGEQEAESFLAMRDRIDELGRTLAQLVPPDAPTGVASANTNSDGNLFLVVYKVAAGEQFRATRLDVEAYGYTPAVPYANAAAWVAGYSTEADQVPGGTFTGVGNALQGGQLFFGPPVAGEPILPFLYTAQESEAPEVRGPNLLALVIVGGPASTRVTVRYQGTLRRERGIV